MLSAKEAARLTDVPNVRQEGIRLGNWLTTEQAKELLQIPDRTTLKGKRDYAILALLVGCVLRRRVLASRSIKNVQMRENHWLAPTFSARRPDPEGGRSGLGQARDRPGKPQPASRKGRYCGLSPKAAGQGRV